MREDIKKANDILRVAGMTTLAEMAGVTTSKIEEVRQTLFPETQVASTDMPPVMPPAMPPAQPMPNQMQRPMNVRPADPRRMANMQNVQQALDSESPLDNLAMMRRAARGGQAISGFSGKVPGKGHGMEDNVYMPIVDNGEQVATLAVSPDEYVVDAHTMSALGNGSADAGADVMDQIVKEVRQEAYGTTEQPDQINGLQSLRNKMIG
jgi:hypothetical protein